MAIADLQHRMRYDVKDFGVLANGSEEPPTAFQAAIDSGEQLFIGDGHIVLEPGSSITLRNDLDIQGSGRERAIITSEDAYAFASPTTGPTDRVRIADISFRLAAGSTSGGAIASLSDSYQSGWHLMRLNGSGQAGVPDAVFYLPGWIGSYAHESLAQGSDYGWHLDGGPFPANANSLIGCRGVSCAEAGFLVTGGAVARIQGGIAESCVGGPGIGVDILDAPGCIVEGMWFEDNTGPHIRVRGGANGTKLLNSHFRNHNIPSTASHIKLEGPADPAALYHVRIDGNDFYDAPGTGGYNVDIDPQCAGTILGQGNRWYNTAPDPVINDLGTGTRYFDNATGDDYPTPNRVGGPWEAAFQPYYDTQLPTMTFRRRASQTTPLHQFEDENEVILAKIDYLGRIVQHQSLGMLRDIATANLGISGGTAGNLGGNVLLYGESHASTPGLGMFRSGGTIQLRWSATGLGFFGTGEIAKPTVTGSRAGNAALASLLTQLAALGLITDSTSA